MTQDVAAVTGDSDPAPDGHYWATMKGRRVLVADLTAGQALVLGGLIRQEKNSDLDSNFAALGKLMMLFDTLIVRAEDREWLETGILKGEVDVQDFSFVFLGVETPAPAAKPKKPRRGK